MTSSHSFWWKPHHVVPMQPWEGMGGAEEPGLCREPSFTFPSDPNAREKASISHFRPPTRLLTHKPGFLSLLTTDTALLKITNDSDVKSQGTRSGRDSLTSSLLSPSGTGLSHVAVSGTESTCDGKIAGETRRATLSPSVTRHQLPGAGRCFCSCLDQSAQTRDMGKSSLSAWRPEPEIKV